MTLKRKTIKISLFGIFIFIISLIAIPLLFIFANIYCQSVGLPKIAHDKIVSYALKNGLRMTGKCIKASLIGDFVVEDFTVQDFNLDNLDILSCKELRLEFSRLKLVRGQVELKSIKVTSGVLELPILKADEVVGSGLYVRDLEVQVFCRDNQLHISRLSGKLNQVQFSIGGKVNTPVDQKYRQFNVDNLAQGVSFVPLLKCSQKLSDLFAHTVELLSILDSDSKIELDVRFDLAIEDLSRSTIKFQLLAEQVLYRGLFFEAIKLDAEYKKEKISGLDIEIILADDENIRGKFNYDVPIDEISGELTFQGFPYKFIKAFFPELFYQLNAFNTIPQFADKPMSARIMLHPSPLQYPSKWDLTTSVELHEIRYRDALINSLKGMFGYRDKYVSFSGLSVQIEPETDINASGLYSLSKNTLVTDAEISGSPVFPIEFSSNEKFNQAFKKFWNRFEWVGESKPRFEVSMYYHPNGTRKPELYLDTRGEMQDVIYHGVQYDRAIGKVLFDFPNSQMIIEDLEFRKERQNTEFALVWKARLAEFEFEITSSSAPSDLLTLFNPGWNTFLSEQGFSFAENPNISAHGGIFPRDTAKTNIDVFAHGTSVNYRQSIINDYDAIINIRQNRTSIEADIEEVLYDECTLHGVTADVVAEKDKTHLTGFVMDFKGFGTDVYETDYRAVYENQLIVVDTQSRNFQRGKWKGREIEAHTTYNGLNTQSETQFDFVEFDDFLFSDVSTSVLLEQDQMAVRINIGQAIQPDQLTMSNIRGEGTVLSDNVAIKGEVERIHVLPIDGISNDVIYELYNEDSTLEIKLDSDRLTCYNALELNGIHAIIQFENDLLTGKAKVRDVLWPDKLSASGLDGKFNRINDIWSIDYLWSEVEFPFLRLSNVQTKGSIINDQFSSTVMSKLIEFNRYTMNDVTATITFENEDLSLNRISGNLYSGKANSDIFYNFNNKKGKMWLTLVDLDFGLLTNESGHDQTNLAQGNLSGKVDLDFELDQGELLLNGDGKVMIDHGNFWKVPIVSDFLSAVNNILITRAVLPQRDVGEISEISSELKFENQLVAFDNLKTDGSILAIYADGNYWWKSQELDFRVTARPLNPFFSKFLPKAIDPFAILLERRLKGTLKEPTWEEVSALRDLFRPKEVDKEPPAM